MIAFNTAAAGALNATRMFDRAATKVAQSAGSDMSTLLGAVVVQSEARTAFAANLAVMKTAEEMTGRLLDLKI
ncbi:hypothetical protein [Asticcacaulis excentricus]|uniref:Flagellar basal-body/hook protein C-terminal domain-containing protein n=1 Tax=Asticcacaulis excentricus (strain ATCC 15261 / DSM 4724 / KCTC 12464 / NCIMB 9791 / VKM B-1370 / CB 48) TaxID=573065 RepID=E8RRM1_ASTEC|nr:hypothetical protein [Asticcacaulis excentricus]ADU13466.1 protein of unknown function DUF1078 domain protein [Asticcacaulis excentricus CB 48]